MKRKRIYISIPISGHDLEEVKGKAIIYGKEIMFEQ